MNKIAFNMGYHNEHYDLIKVPWNNLPKFKRIAPEFYDSLKSYSSWAKLVLKFIFDKNMSPYNRIAHPDTGSVKS
jgi:sphingolipid delta-4 desaturase